MPSKYEKNYTDKGYLMKYQKGTNIIPYKKWVLQFRIELSEIEPLIWRRILVPTNYNFWDLHVAVQDSLGWSDYHLHHFEIKGKGKKKLVRIGIPDIERFYDLPEVYPGWEIPVLQHYNDLGVTGKYLYDYGDSWWHSIQLEGYLFKNKNLKYPLCIDGERACPPEDCGGISGYYELLETLSNPEDEDYEDTRIWVGKNWDAEKFDKNNIKFMNPFKRWETAFFE
jgi:hypothetical protein